MSQETRNTPKPVEFDTSAYPNLVVDVTCGSCLFFKRHAHSKYRGPCNTLGVQEISRPCKVFTPEPISFNFRSEKELRLLAKVLMKISKNHLRLLATMLLREHKTRAKGFKFGQPVWVKVFGGDYISNYRKAYIAHVERDKVYLTAGVNRNIDKVFTACVKKTSVLTKPQWLKKKSTLTTKGFIKDPNYKQYTSFIGNKPDPLNGYEVPTIDTDFAKIEKRNIKSAKTNFTNINSEDRTDTVFRARG